MAKFFGYTYDNSQIVPSLSQFHSNLCSISIPGPFGERDEEQVFIQRVIPETSSIFIRHSSTGNRYSLYVDDDRQGLLRGLLGAPWIINHKYFMLKMEIVLCLIISCGGQPLLYYAFITA